MNTVIDIQIRYSGKLEMSDVSELFDRIKGSLGTCPVSEFHFEATYDEAEP
jgi:hypothetical protein